MQSAVVGMTRQDDSVKPSTPVALGDSLLRSWFHMGCGTDRRQTHVNKNGEMLPDDGIAIRRPRVALGVLSVMRFGKRRSLRKRSSALGAAIAFTDANGT